MVSGYRGALRGQRHRLDASRSYNSISALKRRKLYHQRHRLFCYVSARAPTESDRRAPV